MKRAIRTLICLVASGLIVFGGMEIGLEYTRHRLRGEPIHARPWIIGSALIVGGVILFVASSKLAEKLAGDFDE